MSVYVLLHLKKIFKIPKKLFFRRYTLLIRSIRDGLNEKLGRTY